MKQKILITVLLLSSLTLFTLSCQKESAQKQQPQEEIATTIGTANNPTFNLEVILRGEDGRLGMSNSVRMLTLQKSLYLTHGFVILNPITNIYYKEQLMQRMLLTAIVPVQVGLHSATD